jgi:hypothetical protein
MKMSFAIGALLSIALSGVVGCMEADWGEVPQGEAEINDSKTEYPALIRSTPDDNEEEEQGICGSCLAPQAKDRTRDSALSRATASRISIADQTPRDGQGATPAGGEIGGGFAPNEAHDLPAFSVDDFTESVQIPGIESIANMEPSAATSSSIVRHPKNVRAGETWFNPGNSPFLELGDTRCDDKSVFVLYTINNEDRVTRKENNGGCGTTLRIPLVFGGPIDYQTCINLPLAPDVCGPEVRDYN